MKRSFARSDGGGPTSFAAIYLPGPCLKQTHTAGTFARADDGAAQALGDSAASAEATVMTDQAASDQTQGNDDAAAETDFAHNEADQTENSWYGLATSGMVGHTGDAWATFEYHKAQALQSWQTTADTNYKNYVSSLASDEVTYAGTDSQKFLSEAQTIDAADQTDGDGTADADQTLVNTLAGDEVAYETVAATATGSYQAAMAQAAHDYTVAVANAIDAYAHDNDNTKYTSALATASTNLSTAQQTAGTVYANGTTANNNADGLGAATATQETNDANALLTDATTVANDDLTDAQTADLQIDTDSKAESDAFDTQTKNDAAALDTLIKGDADSLKSAAATADGSNASSWMDAWSSEVAADDTKEDTQAGDAMNATDQAADALDTKEKGEADGQQQKSDADAQAIHDKLVNDAQAAYTKSTTDATNITNAVAKDAYFATLPDAYPAFDWSTVPDPAVLDASYDEVYAVDDLALSLSAGQDDGSSPLPVGDVIGAMYITPAIGGASPLLPGEGQGEGSSSAVLGQSFSLGATTDPYGQIPGIATPTGPGLLSDNGIYDPANPYAAGFTGWSGAQWLNVGQTLPGSGGSGSPGMPPPQTPGGGGTGSGGSQGGGSSGAPAESVPPSDPKAARLNGDQLSPDNAREHVPGLANVQFLDDDHVLIDLPKEGKRPDGWDGGIGIPFMNREFVWKSWRWGENGERDGLTVDVVPKDRGVSPRTDAIAAGTVKATAVIGATAFVSVVAVAVAPEALAASGIVIATGQVLVLIGITDGTGRVVANIPVLMDADSTPAQIEEATYNILTGGSEVIGGGLFAKSGGFKPGPLGYGNLDYNLYAVPPGMRPLVAPNSLQEAASVAVHYEPGMPPTQFWKKMRALLELSDRGVLVKAPNPVARDPSVVAGFRRDMQQRIEQVYGQTNPSFRDQLLRRLQDRTAVDHAWELQLGGPDTRANLQFLDKFTNWNIGTQQIWPQIRNLPNGTRITITVVNSNGVPIKTP